jgi:hypothetical protein
MFSRVPSWFKLRQQSFGLRGQSACVGGGVPLDVFRDGVVKKRWSFRPPRCRSLNHLDHFLLESHANQYICDVPSFFVDAPAQSSGVRIIHQRKEQALVRLYFTEISPMAVLGQIGSGGVQSEAPFNISLKPGFIECSYAPSVFLSARKSVESLVVQSLFQEMLPT